MTVVLQGHSVDRGRAIHIGIEHGQITEVNSGAHDDRVVRRRRGKGTGAVGEIANGRIVPGLVDLQVNGYEGGDFNDDNLTVEKIRAIVVAEWRRGVTTLCPTLVTAPEDKILHSLSLIATARRCDALLRWSIPCVHVEGPYLSPEDGPRGAHDLDALRLPDIDELRRWQRVSGDIVGIVTVAPELPGAVAYIRAASASGVVIGLGHSAAGPGEVRAAVEAGAKMSTHLGNGCAPLLHRHANLIWTQLAETRLMAGFIADGHHLPKDVFVSMVRAKGAPRSVLVSDSVALAGSPPGTYHTAVGGDVELSADRRLSLAGTKGELLAGSVSCLSECLAWAVFCAGLRWSVALNMTTRNPSRLVAAGSSSAQSLWRDRGQIRVGASADLCALDVDEESGRLQVRSTWVKGVMVHPDP